MPSSDEIAGRVLYNHFYAIERHIDLDLDRYKLNKINYFDKKIKINTNADLQRIKKLVWNSWSTEIALKYSQSQDKDKFCCILQWSFPKAYYSVYLLTHAFYLSLNEQSNDHTKIIRIFGEKIKQKNYPKCISFYIDNTYPRFNKFNLNEIIHQRKAIDSVRKNSIIEADSQILILLKTTRKKFAEILKNNKQKDKKNAIKTKKGTIKTKLNNLDWSAIYKKIPITTILSFLYKFRIKSNYEDIKSILNINLPNEDSSEFHRDICFIVDYMNFIHEAYLIKSIGIKNYEDILNTFPKPKLIKETAKDRFEKFIKPLFNSNNKKITPNITP